MRYKANRYTLEKKDPSLVNENYLMLVLRASSNLQVVAHHNRLRSRVASGLTRLPPARNMLEVHWDEELAQVAQRLADQCVFDHDCSECRRVGRFSVGQNLYQAFTTRTEERTDWVGAIDSWFNEIELLPISSISSFAFSPSTGHFTQLAWAATNKIGCGVTQYPSGRWAQSLFSLEAFEKSNLLFSSGSWLVFMCATMVPPET